MTPQQWIKATNAIGIVSKSGRYGGTYAHTDIAFEFASWISPEFKLYIIKDYQRLKKDEADRFAIGWDVKRELSKINYRIHTDAVKEFLITPTLSPQEMAYTYASEADILNMALFGKTAAQWRNEKGIKGKNPNIRDFASAEELVVLINLEDTNADLIRQEVPKIERLKMGTSSKWALEWVEKYQAYKIHAMTDGEKDMGNVWDVRHQSGDEYELIHIWDDNSNDQNRNTSNLWRFIRQQDGSYKIQSARTGKFAHDGQIDKDGKSLPWLSQTSDGTAFEVEFFASDGDKISYNYSEDWMAQLPDDAVLSSVNLPGSHDAGTAAIVEDGIPQISFTSCQKYYYEEQLNVGVRSFDIRCNALSDDAALSDVIIIHGNERWHCSNRDATALTLDNILNESVRFLDEHPTETVVMMVKPDDGSTVGLVKAMASFIKAEVAKGDECHVWTGNEIPSVKEARGKIVFLRRYEIDKSKYDPAADGLQERWFGIDLSKWDDYSYGDTKYAIKIYGQDQYGTAVYAQDAYSENANGKIEYIEGTMAQTTGADTTHAIPADSWIFNYTSCSKWIPLNVTKDLNPQLFADEFGKDKSGYIDNRRLGMVMLNFVDRPMSRLIYETNLKDNDFLTAKAVFPESISLSQGQRLSDAKLSGQLGGGRWVFEKGDYVPTLEDFKSGKTFRLKFIPDDDRLQGVERDVTITSFEQKTPAGQTDADNNGSASGTNTSDSTAMAAIAAAAMIALLALLGVLAAVKLRKEH